MPETLLCDTHRSEKQLMRDLRSTHMGQFIYHRFPLAICRTASWTRLVLYPCYLEHLYPEEYYQGKPSVELI